ncbi:MAG: aldehyde dehydrogenase family protein [Xanthobacteraceae bacterium]|nr:aldehyde dehydrogenase family protein [Xanthobacteraceae bacterium]
MDNASRFYINGRWVEPFAQNHRDIVNPATEERIGLVSLGAAVDVDRAVAAAKAAFQSYSQTSRQERVVLLRRIVSVYQTRIEDMARAVTLEMGSPHWFAKSMQTELAMRHFVNAADILEQYPEPELRGSTLLVREPIGVCGFVTAWNWPLSLIIAKVGPALAAGCTVVLKPSEFSPLSATILAEIIHDAGAPAGVFNLVHGDGPTVGHAISSHPDVDMVSITGSTRAGVAVAKAAADTVKRVHQELGGKSAHIILPDADLSTAVPWGVLRSYLNSGQSCEAPTRMFVHRRQLDDAADIAQMTANAEKVGDPLAADTRLGPLVNRVQFDRVQELIKSGIDEGADMVTGGLGLPEGLNRGFYVRPTVFAGVTSDMRIAREEIFGPVLSIIAYDSEDQAIKETNASIYGLAGYVHSRDLDRARRVASQIRAGRIYVNGAPPDPLAPFGGYKQSGNGRQNGIFGFEEYLEIKAVIGYSQ